MSKVTLKPEQIEKATEENDVPRLVLPTMRATIKEPEISPYEKHEQQPTDPTPEPSLRDLVDGLHQTIVDGYALIEAVRERLKEKA